MKSLIHLEYYWCLLCSTWLKETWKFFGSLLTTLSSVLPVTKVWIPQVSIAKQWQRQGKVFFFFWCVPFGISFSFRSAALSCVNWDPHLGFLLIHMGHASRPQYIWKVWNEETDFWRSPEPVSLLCIATCPWRDEVLVYLILGLAHRRNRWASIYAE